MVDVRNTHHFRDEYRSALKNGIRLKMTMADLRSLAHLEDRLEALEAKQQEDERER